MTITFQASVFLGVMKITNYLSIFVLIHLPLCAQEQPPHDKLLRQAIYLEEVDRDPAKASALYEQLVEHSDNQRTIAATALYRLAEIHRKQGEKDEAIVLYQRLITSYPDCENEAKLAREHLMELHGVVPSAPQAVASEEAELEKLKEEFRVAPDKIDPDYKLEKLHAAIKQAKPKIVAFLLETGVQPDEKCCMAAAESARLDICKLIFSQKLPHKVMSETLFECVIPQKRLEVLRLMLELGLDPDLEWHRGRDYPLLEEAVNEEWFKGVELLVEAGADINAEDKYGSAVIRSARSDKMTFQLIELGANPNGGSSSYIPPIAVVLGLDDHGYNRDMKLKEGSEIIKTFLKAGMNPNPVWETEVSEFTADGETEVTYEHSLVMDICNVGLSSMIPGNVLDPDITHSDIEPAITLKGIEAIDMVNLLIEAGAKLSDEEKIAVQKLRETTKHVRQVFDNLPDQLSSLYPPQEEGSDDMER